MNFVLTAVCSFLDIYPGNKKIRLRKLGAARGLTAQLRRLWESINVEIIRVLEAVNALRESPDFELLTLTERTPEFFDETVSLHLEGLEAELARLKAEADGLAGEIEELTGAGAGIGE